MQDRKWEKITHNVHEVIEYYKHWDNIKHIKIMVFNLLGLAVLV